MKDFVLGVVVAGLVAIAGYALLINSQPNNQSDVDPLGNTTNAGNNNSIAIGGNVLATTSPSGGTVYTAAQIVNNRLINHVASGALTANLPTMASLSAAGFLKSAGSTYTMFIHASTSVITLAGNTGVSLQSASSTKNIPPGVTGRLDFTRLPANEGRRIDVLLTTD